MLFLKFSLGFSNCIVVDRVGLGGGLALLWNSTFDVALQSFSVGHIDVHVTNKNDGVGWLFTGFYGNPELEHRRDSWQLLERIGRGRLGP